MRSEHKQKIQDAEQSTPCVYILQLTDTRDLETGITALSSEQRKGHT